MEKEKKIVLMHFGDQCAPHILLFEILDIKEKQLFQLGFFYFNHTLEYLKEGNLHEMYNINYFRDHAGRNLIVHPSISENLYYHAIGVTHAKYGFTFFHNYKLLDQYILNYQYNVESFKEKIKLFEEIIKRKDILLYFINFARDDSDVPKIDEMIELFKQKQIENFKFIFLANSMERIEKINESKNKQYYHTIFLSNSYFEWYNRDMKDRYDLYKEIYEKFLETDELTKKQFPPFEKTKYYLAYAPHTPQNEEPKPELNKVEAISHESSNSEPISNPDSWFEKALGV